MKACRLSDAVDILSGTSFAKKPVHDPAGDYFVLESHALNSDGSLKPDKLIRVSSKSLSKPKQPLVTNDLLIRAKGSQHTASLYQQPDSTLPVFATSYFLILRVKKPSLLTPEFLTLHLNEPQTQSRLSACAKGSTVRHISKATLMEFEINIPKPNKQKKLVELATLHYAENNLRRQIEQLRSEHLKSVSYYYLNEEVENP